MNTTTDDEMIKEIPEILRSCQKRVLLRDHLSRLVVKERWPDRSEFTGSVTFAPSFLKLDEGVDYTTREYSLRHAAVNSPMVDLSNVDKGIVKQSLYDCSYWLWSSFFRDEVSKLIQHRIVVLGLPQVSPDLTRIKSSNAKRINLFGKTVQQYIRADSRIGTKYVINPKYKRAAEQVIFFHPDIVHFQFPNDDTWVGEIVWRNIPDAELNPDCKSGFYRLITTAAAKPIIPNYGMIATVVPKGIRGLIYYWAWQLCGFVP